MQMLKFASHQHCDSLDSRMSSNLVHCQLQSHQQLAKPEWGNCCDEAHLKNSFKLLYQLQELDMSTYAASQGAHDQQIWTSLQIITHFSKATKIKHCFK